jgi:hypothetical protein
VLSFLALALTLDGELAVSEKIFMKAAQAAAGLAPNLAGACVLGSAACGTLGLTASLQQGSTEWWASLPDCRCSLRTSCFASTVRAAAAFQPLQG